MSLKNYEFEKLYENNFTKLFYFAYNILNDYRDSEDAVADAFVSIWNRWNELSNIENITAYLYRSVRNNCLKIREKKHLSLDLIEETSFDLIIDPQSPELNLLSKEAIAKIIKAIGELPPRCKLVFILAKEQEMTYSEISILLDISTKTVQNQMTKALDHLRKTLKEYNINDS